MTSDLLEENQDLRKQVAELENELKAEKEYSATLRKEIDEYTNSHTLCAKYKELEKENAVLKERADREDNIIEALKKQIAEMDLYITKAEDIIKGLIETNNPIYFEEDRQRAIAQAEQFIKGE